MIAVVLEALKEILATVHQCRAQSAIVVELVVVVTVVLRGLGVRVRVDIGRVAEDVAV